jgi:hypothetical protein
MQIRWNSLIVTALAAAGMTGQLMAQTTNPPAPGALPVVPAAPAQGSQSVVPAAPAPGSLSVVPAAPADSFGRPQLDIGIGGPTASSSCPGGNCAPAAEAQPFTPVMLGDFVGPVANLFTNFKIAEGESPRPMDRVFFKYNYYDNINPGRWTDPTEPIHNVKLDLYTLGFEKTFFDGIMSLGVRIPFYTLDAEGKDVHLGPDPATGAVGPIPGGPGFDETEVGNLVAIAKAVLWEDRKAGDLLSAGVVVSFPTASNQMIDPGQSTLMYFQPFSGFILTSGDLYFQGFSSMTLPVARPESIVSFNDVGVGYYVYRDATGTRMISAVSPTFEIHYTAPLRQADPKVNLYNLTDDQRVHNTVDLTAGATFEIQRRATLGVGLAVPVTGLRPFDMEALVQLNYLF